MQFVHFVHWFIQLCCADNVHSFAFTFEREGMERTSRQIWIKMKVRAERFTLSVSLSVAFFLHWTLVTPARTLFAFLIYSFFPLFFSVFALFYHSLTLGLTLTDCRFASVLLIYVKVIIISSHQFLRIDRSSLRNKSRSMAAGASRDSRRPYLLSFLLSSRNHSPFLGKEPWVQPGKKYVPCSLPIRISVFVSLDVCSKTSDIAKQHKTKNKGVMRMFMQHCLLVVCLYRSFVILLIDSGNIRVPLITMWHSLFRVIFSPFFLCFSSVVCCLLKEVLRPMKWRRKRIGNDDHHFVFFLFYCNFDVAGDPHSFTSFITLHSSMCMFLWNCWWCTVTVTATIGCKDSFSLRYSKSVIPFSSALPYCYSSYSCLWSLSLSFVTYSLFFASRPHSAKYFSFMRPLP